MISKKGLLKFVKYTLIFSNAFGFILSIFLGLFGIAYPDKHFPLSYKGREMALCSLFCMLVTTIGYCGAQNHRRILLIVYGATNVIIVIIVVILWILFRENSILGNKEINNMFITSLAVTIAVMFLFSFILAFHIKTFKSHQNDSIMSQSQQLLQQTTAFLQQQQHLQQQQQQQHQHHLNLNHQTNHHPGGGFGHTLGHVHGQNSLQQQHQHLQMQTYQPIAPGTAHPVGQLHSPQPQAQRMAPPVDGWAPGGTQQHLQAGYLPAPSAFSPGSLRRPSGSAHHKLLVGAPGTSGGGSPPPPPAPPPPQTQVQPRTKQQQLHQQPQQARVVTKQQQQQPPGAPQVSKPPHAGGSLRDTRAPPGSARGQPPCPVQFCTFQCDGSV